MYKKVFSFFFMVAQYIVWASPVSQQVKNPPAVQQTPEMQVHPWVGRSPGGGNGNRSSVLAWEVPGTEESDEL